MKRNNLNKILVPTISLFVVFGLVVYILFSATAIFGNYEKLQTYDNNITVYEQNIAKLKNVSVTELADKLNFFNLQIPVGGDVTNLINDTLKLANSYGLAAQRDIQTDSKTDKSKQKAVNIQDLQSGDPEVVGESLLISGLVYPINLTITVNGQKADVIKFLESVTRRDRILNVVGIVLAPESFSNSNGTNSVARLTIFGYAILDRKPDTRKDKPITDPMDPKLLETPRRINTQV